MAVSNGSARIGVGSRVQERRISFSALGDAWLCLHLLMRKWTFLASAEPELYVQVFDAISGADFDLSQLSSFIS